MEKADMRLSVIIPCFNDGAYVGQAVDSVRSGGVNCEIIVVNDGSTDSNTLLELEKLEARGISVVHQANLGVGAARNSGIRLARGCYVLPLDADNRIRSSYLTRGAAVLERNPLVDVVYADANFIGDREGRWTLPEFNFRLLLTGNFIDACAVIRKSAWERCGGYDEAMPVQGWEDWDLWLRIALTGGRFVHLSEPLFDYRVRSTSMSAGMKSPGREKTAFDYVYSKRVTVPLGDYAKLDSLWDYAVEETRTKPVRTIARLLIRAYWPKLRPSFWRSKTRQSS